MASVGGTFVVDVAVDPLMVDELRRLNAQISALAAANAPAQSLAATVAGLYVAASSNRKPLPRRSLLGLGLIGRG